MKAITIHQPYAELIARGEKRIENRTWRTNHQGPIAIHAGLARGARWREAAARYGVDLANVPQGAIVAVAASVDCVRLFNLRSRDVGPHAEGPWCWVLAGVRRLDKPIPIAGKQSLWNVPAEIEAEIARQLG